MVHKFKKYSKKFMCMLSAGMFFVMAVFYPLESFRAEVLVPSNEKSLSFSYSYNESNILSEDSLIPLPPTDLDIEVDVGGAVQIDDYNYFYYTTRVRQLFSTSSSIYAYKILIDSYEVSTNSSSNWHSKNVYIGSEDDIYSLSGVYGNVIDADTVCWYVSDFSHGIPIYFTHLYTLYEYTYSDSSLGAFAFNYPSISFNGNYTVSIVGYTVDDLTDEIYATLQNIYSTNNSMLSKLNQIYSSIDSVEMKLQDLVDIAEQIETNTDELEGLLKTCNSYLASIQTELEEQTSWLQKIYNAIIEYFGLQGDDSVEEMPDQEMDNMLNIESELLGDASASDLQNDLNVSIDADSGSFVWNLIDRLITSNSVVFGGFISVLSLGIVALILGR